MVLLLAGEQFLSMELVLCTHCARIHYVCQHARTESEGETVGRRGISRCADGTGCEPESEATEFYLEYS